MIRWIDWCLDCDAPIDVDRYAYCAHTNTTRAVVIIDNEEYQRAFGTPSPLDQLQQEL